MSTETVAVILIRTHGEAENAVRELQRSGFDMKNLSIAGKDHRVGDAVAGCYDTGDLVGVWGEQGAFWAGLWGILFGYAFFVIPGMGPIVVAGPLVSAIVEGLQSAVVVGESSALHASLCSVGPPEQDGLKRGPVRKTEKYVVVLHGSDEELARAREILSSIVGRLQGDVVFGGLSPIGTGLHSMGVPRGDILRYETAIKSRRLVVVLHGSTSELAKGRRLLTNMGHEVQVH
jgi:hypothetical protein